MHTNRLSSTKKNAKVHYLSISKLLYGEVLYKTIVVALLIVINIILLVYASSQLDRVKLIDSHRLFKWLLLLLYCGGLIDIESSKSLRICLSILILINFICIERDALIVGITLDLFNLGVIRSVFDCEEFYMDSKYSYEDEYILPLIDSNRRLLSIYYELWKKNNYGRIKNYNGLLVTRCILMSCIYLCIMLITTIGKYTNFDKHRFIDMKNVIYLKNTTVISSHDFINKVFQLCGENGIVTIQIIIVTLTVLLRPLLLKILKQIKTILNKIYLTLTGNLTSEELGQGLGFGIEQINNQHNADIVSDNINGTISTRNKSIDSFMFFFSTLLFGIITYEKPEFDIISRMFLIGDDQTILLCILLPLVGLLTEISVLKDWPWYFLFSWMVYYFNTLLDDPIVRSFTTMLSGGLFNISAVLFACNQFSAADQYGTTNRYALTNYVLHRMCYQMGFSVAKSISVHTSSLTVKGSLFPMKTFQNMMTMKLNGM
ncbi:putative transmembrane domain-containing protein [Cryptosporidium canis]|uniref:Transmembrane domain-containing protein n=1 Tax=Cryptosporidium canis TaxID=195482 RepID=A0A9D5DED7_9CRYT|nr:putative transmembrane domain-containing protein [Cryptosporidium canis]